MFDKTIMQELLTGVTKIAKNAGKKILEVYQSDDFELELKSDNSPLTKADLMSHELIVAELKKLRADIPVLSEESKTISYSRRSNWPRFWMVDPLDGTKEFVKRNDEFTVNIALIEQNRPVLGVVYLPVFDVIYYAAKGLGAFCNEKPIKTKEVLSDKLSILASKSHINEETERLIAKIKKDYQVDILKKGSALKLCYIADGQADFYPRLGPTMEWDTAAAQIIVEEAGGKVMTTRAKKLRYNKRDLLNPSFVVTSAAFADKWQEYVI